MPVQIDVLTPMPEGWGMCQTCEFIISQANLTDSPSQRMLDSFPKDWQDEFTKTSHLIFDIAGKFGNSIQMVLYDPRSLQGMIKALRFRVRHFPAFIISNKGKYIGWDSSELEKLIVDAGGIIEYPNASS